jgi:hypothetical protein
MRTLTRPLVIVAWVAWAAATAASPGCLVLSLNPAYDAETIGWEPALLGAWADADDKSSMDVEGGEWKSYRIKYVHPIETGTLTGYLTIIGDDRFLDVMPARGEDRGSFVIPAHVVLRVKLDGDRLELTPLSYDWMNERLRAGTRIPGVAAVLDQKDNALFVSPTAALRAWLRKQPREGPMFGAAATFTRKSAQLPHEVR